MSVETAKTTDEQDAKLSFLVSTSEGIHENIQFADAKAGVLITVNGGLIAGLYAAIRPEQVHSLWGGLLVCLLLAVSIGFGFAVIWPRGDRNRDRGAGLVDSLRIIQHGDAAFARHIAEASRETLIADMALFLHDRAYIDRQKYRCLRVALVVAGIAWVLSLAYAAAMKISGIGA